MTAQLPVLNHQNHPIENPDSFDVNTAMQRCLAKAISLHGIGLYIYAGEDLPMEPPKEPIDYDTTPCLVTKLETKLSPKTADKAEGEDWKAWIATLSDGRVAGTFKADCMNLLDISYSGKKEAIIKTVPGQRQGSLEVVRVEVGDKIWEKA